MKFGKTLEDIDTGRGFVVQQGELIDYEDIEWHYNATFTGKRTAREFFRDIDDIIKGYCYRIEKKR